MDEDKKLRKKLAALAIAEQTPETQQGMEITDEGGESDSECESDDSLSQTSVYEYRDDELEWTSGDEIANAKSDESDVDPDMVVTEIVFEDEEMKEK